MLAAVATSPLIPLALFLMNGSRRRSRGRPRPAIGFLITAAVAARDAWLQRRDEGGKGPAETTWLDALLIGLAQMFAPLPGVSRSGLTVATALALGFSRRWAVGFSLLIAVPAILGAAVKELKDVNPATLSGDRVAQIAGGDGRCRPGRVRGHRLAGQGCAFGQVVVFFCIPDRAGLPRFWRSRRRASEVHESRSIAGCPPRKRC